MKDQPIANETNLETAKAFYECLAAGNMAAFFDTLTGDVVAVAPGRRPSIAWAGTWKGKEGFGEMMTTLGEAVEIEMYELDRFLPDGDDRVIVFGRERLRARRTNLRAESAWVHELTLRDGKVSRFVEHYDTHTLAVALASEG